MPKYRVPFLHEGAPCHPSPRYLLKNLPVSSARRNAGPDRRPHRRGLRRRPRLIPGAVGAAIRTPPTGRRVRRPLRRRRLPARPEARQGTAAWLRHAGVAAETLEGGFEGWKAAKLPLVPRRKLPPRDAQGRTVWVTRARPKIDRIACPWLIRRFVDPAAVFLFVAPSEVVAVGERFDAAPFDIENVFWSHRGELCTFDVMVEEFGLATPPLLRLATIVRGADTARLDLAPEAPGLLAASLGLSRMYRRRPRAARGRHAALRRVLSLVPRRDRTRPTTGRPTRRSRDGCRDRRDDRSRRKRDAGHGISFGEAFRVWLRVAAAELRRPGRADRGDAPHPGRGEALDLARAGSCTR